MSLWVLVLAAVALQGDAQPFRPFAFRATIRNFLPARCMNNSEVMFAWDESPPVQFGLTIDAYTNLGYENSLQTHPNLQDDGFGAFTVPASEYCHYWPYLRSGEIKAHPDFQAYSAGDADALVTGVSDCTFGGTQIATEGQTVGDCDGSLGPLIKPYLVKATSGLPKVVACSEIPTDKCGCKTGGRCSASRAMYFKSWYNDDKQYNKRVGLKIDLSTSDGTTYRFQPSGNWFPLDIYQSVASEERYPNPADAIIWPNFDPNENEFLFTTEIHTHFIYRGFEEFDFSGDDDVFVFINGKLIIDLGGVHGEETSSVDLSDESIRQALGLEINQTYSFDMFHAERQRTDSNFDLTTSLTEVCNVFQSGTMSFNSSQDEFILSNGAIFDAGRLDLVGPSTTAFTSQYAYLPEQQNLGSGFLMDFTFTVSNESEAEGFAVVFHRRSEGLVNLPPSTGAGLGYKFLRNSFAIVFDLCFDRNSGSCTEQEVSVNFPSERNGFAGGSPPSESPTVSPTPVPSENSTFAPSQSQTSSPTVEAFNGPDKKVVFDNVIRSLRIENEPHRVSIEYLENPDWLEVYIDDSLYLRVDDFDPEDIVGARSAFVGFTTATPSNPAAISFSGVSFTSVDVDTKKTRISGPLSEPRYILADGEQVVGIEVETRDGCDELITFGGRGTLIRGIYVERLEITPDPVEFEDEVEYSRRRLRALQDGPPQSYFNGSMTPGIFDAQTIDLRDGSYTVGLATTTPGTFDLYVCVGTDELECDFNITFVDSVNSTAKLAQVEFIDAAVYSALESVVRVIPVTPSPTKSPITLPPTLGPDSGNATVIAGAAGGSALLFLILISFLALYFRRRWNRDQAFIEDGKLYNMERDVKYDKNDEFAVVSRMVMGTQQEILRERAKKVGDGADVITELEEEHEKLQEQLRQEKQAAEAAKQQAAATSIFSRFGGRKNKGKAKKEFLPDL